MINRDTVVVASCPGISQAMQRYGEGLLLPHLSGTTAPNSQTEKTAMFPGHSCLLFTCLSHRSFHFVDMLSFFCTKPLKKFQLYCDFVTVHQFQFQTTELFHFNTLVLHGRQNYIKLLILLIFGKTNILNFGVGWDF